MTFAWSRPTGRHIYVCQLRDAKITPWSRPCRPTASAGTPPFAAKCWRGAHSRTADAVILSAYLGKSTAFDDAIGSFALAYARQTDLDHARLVGAIGAGQLPATAQDS